MRRHAELPSWGAYGDPFSQSNQALPLVSDAQPFQRGGNVSMYDDEYDDHKSFHTDDYKGSRYGHQDTQSNIGSESYAPSRNMFQTADVKKAPGVKDALAGEIMEGEVAEEIKDSASRRRWVAVCWLLTRWIPTPILTYVGRMKRMDIRQAWREKLAINLIIWFIGRCAAFVIVFLSNIICPKEYVFNTSELASHSTTGSESNQLFTAVRGEVFDLTVLLNYHVLQVPVVTKQSLQQYGGVDATDLFPVQVRRL
jgi:chitin synthase